MSLNHLDVEVGILKVNSDEPVPLLNLGKNALERQHPKFPSVEVLIQLRISRIGRKPPSFFRTREYRLKKKRGPPLWPL